MTRAVRAGACSAARDYAGPARILAAAGLFAEPQPRTPRPAEYHANAGLIADRVARTKAVIDQRQSQSNIVIFRLPPALPDAAEVVQRAQRGAFWYPPSPPARCAQRHLNVTGSACRRAGEVLAGANPLTLAVHRAIKAVMGSFLALSLAGVTDWQTALTDAVDLPPSPSRRFQPSSAATSRWPLDILTTWIPSCRPQYTIR